VWGDGGCGYQRRWRAPTRGGSGPPEERVGSSATAPPSLLVRTPTVLEAATGVQDPRRKVASSCFVSPCAGVELTFSMTFVVRTPVFSVGSASSFLLFGSASPCLSLPPRQGGPRRRRASEREARWIQPPALPSSPSPLSFLSLLGGATHKCVAR
jgi:hypothetical protein